MQSVVNDLEFSGVLNRAAKPGQAQTFSLLLSMLQQNLLERPLPARQEQPDTYSSLPEITHTPAIPLQAESAHWHQMEVQGAYIQHQLLASARLWQCMHPSPLALYNDVKRIDDAVTNNCDWHCQQRLKGHSTEPMLSDETALFDILEQLNAA
ncbi:hypothetical protein KJY73_07830 [Bowmanella sp. Y26]|uniref:VC2046/SO_2500 family protein n=1 Tax=Bowmanella yangjiangensis TaxID=2811230 RepID=UPI001BDC8B17|nr:VC2046/SO_2500 family protein [Bowmanella yangjiangensis]MBT1063480.1 hypothetical protein [Bowmanella yangjiangensis]